MTDPTPYTDDDVRHLVALIDEGQYHDSAIHPGSMARRLLAAGVTLPPEPDTPAEPQERFYVEASVDAIPHPRWWVLDRADERNPIRTDAPEDAYLVASLLNLDAKYEDGIEAELERLRDKASARAVKAAELALEDARAELIRELEDRDLERDLFAARVKELEAALDDAHQDDGPTEPLFTGRITTRGNRQHVPDKPDVVVGVPGPVQDKLNLFARVGEQVDVYRLGQRPAAPAQAVTAEMVRRVLGESGALAVAADQGLSPFDVADRLNGLLGRTPEPQPTTNQPVTAEMVYGAVEAAGVRDGLDRGDGPAYIRPCDWTSGEVLAVADALNRLLADREAENERGGSDG